MRLVLLQDRPATVAKLRHVYAASRLPSAVSDSSPSTAVKMSFLVWLMVVTAYGILVTKTMFVVISISALIPARDLSLMDSTALLVMIRLAVPARMVPAPPSVSALLTVTHVQAAVLVTALAKMAHA